MGALGHRLGVLDVTVTSALGPLANETVMVEQVRHEFGFGNIGFELMDYADARADGKDGDPELARAWLSLFNQVTLPFYWRNFEPVEGEPQTAHLTSVAQWFTDRGVRVKGHPLAWHTLAPRWLMDKSDAEVESALVDRIQREVSTFAGLIDHWDAINEAVIMPRFTAEENAITRLAQSRGRVGMVRLAFESAREANPSAKLVLNDFLLTDEYELLIADCLDAGITIDAIGLQTHMHQGFRGEDQLARILDQFSRFGLPLQLTETTLVSGALMPAEIVDLNDYQVESWPSTPDGEARQADDLMRHYLTCLANPLVESITYWGLGDGGMWLGAPAGLLRKDGTHKPAFDGLRDHVHGHWWMDRSPVTTDAQGRLHIEGWGGLYRLSAHGGTADVAVVAGDHGTMTTYLA